MSTDEETERNIRATAKSVFVYGFVALGIVSAAAFTVGLALDISNIDDTRGGYEPPYTNYTGEPIDWTEGDVTNTGFVSRGYALDTYLDCNTGMTSFGILGTRIEYRTLSDRAIAIHDPRQACRAAGFRSVF